MNTDDVWQHGKQLCETKHKLSFSHSYSIIYKSPRNILKQHLQVRLEVPF